MKQFDDYWKENWNEYEWAGCERAGRLCYEDGVKTGMLAAADIVEEGESAGWKIIAGEKIREAAK